ncbi:mannose-6-phosphate isomerase, class I [Rosenbergiella epipactidis]|uniref:mannose-6-phosphate isomerase, class I n=1 Tax=Rosenbergiella epipactidis TaxID=1544694 RepID=UPI001F4F6110|nr:mannose-6-phosphate isomerase, class I [Rosenbergiella epipactidis]
MYKLNNYVQHYDWGSPTALTEHFGYANVARLPMAEVWMGAHSSASSRLWDQGEWKSLAAEITARPIAMLGQVTYERFHQLPFLLKLLAAEKPLSIQVHPTKLAAQQGFAREDSLGIPLNHPSRNYRDTNHKPEVIYALTPFKALNGFKSFGKIAQAFQKLEWDHPAVKGFIECPTSTQLRQLFIACLQLAGEEKQQVLTRLLQSTDQQEGVITQTIQMIAKDWPNDCGLLMPLFLNIVDLRPGEALYLAAGTPHTYLQGMGVEIMANSDNVLRAGLTTKHIDIDELVANVQFQEKKIEQLILAPLVKGNQFQYPVPAADFSLSILNLISSVELTSEGLPQILLCLKGTLQLSSARQHLSLTLGESIFIPANQGSYTLAGQGQIALATVGSMVTPTDKVSLSEEGKRDDLCDFKM